MSTLAEIEKSVQQFSADELTELEKIIHRARRDKEQSQKASLGVSTSRAGSNGSSSNMKVNGATVNLEER